MSRPHFDKETFNPFIYNFNFGSKSELIYRVDNSDYIIIIKSDSIYTILNEMIYNPGTELKEKYEQKLFLGIIHSHILLHLCKYNF